MIFKYIMGNTNQLVRYKRNGLVRLLIRISLEALKDGADNSECLIFLCIRHVLSW